MEETRYVIRIYEIIKGVPELSNEITGIPQSVVDMIYGNKDLTIAGDRYETAVIITNGKMTTIIPENIYIQRRIKKWKL